MCIRKLISGFAITIAHTKVGDLNSIKINHATLKFLKLYYHCNLEYLYIFYKKCGITTCTFNYIKMHNADLLAASKTVYIPTSLKTYI